jgi:hypothetical protein
MLFVTFFFLLTATKLNAEWESLQVGVLYDPRKFRFPQKHLVLLI